jgi:carboxypeptidase Taq
MSPYTDLEARFHRLQALRNALGVLHWDMATMMPAGGAEARAEQLAALNVVCHGMLTEPVVGDLLDHAEGGAANLDEWQRANLREMRRLWVHATALDSKLVEALSKACSASEQVWRDARPKGDFAMQLPALTEVLRLTREAAAAKSARLGVGAYDALLDEYEPGGRSADIDLVFDDLADFLPGLLARVLEHQARQAPPLDLPGPFPVERQRNLGERIMRAMGFEFEHGRLDTSLHPFCGGMPDDVRITTRYAEDDFTGGNGAISRWAWRAA